MIILKAVGTAQEIDVLVRYHTSTTYSLTLTDEKNRTETEQAITGTFLNGRLVFDITHDFDENSFYYFNIKVGVADGDYSLLDYAAEDYLVSVAGSDEIYRGKIFITNQTDLEKFNSVENYEPRETENTYKVYTGE